MTATADADGIRTDQAAAILKELQQIRRLLQRQQGLLEKVAQQRVTQTPDQNVSIPLGNSHALGHDDAPVTLIEFTDYQCPYCSRFHLKTFPQLKKQFIDTGQVRFISRDLPLPIHDHAFPAAQAVRCAGVQGQYWELRDKLSANPRNLSREAIIQYGKSLPLNMETFETCLASETHTSAIQRDIAVARSVGITGTPGFVVGMTPANGNLEGVTIKGAKPYKAFASLINTLLVKHQNGEGVTHK